MRQKLFIYGLALAGMVGVAACSDDDDSKWADVDGAAPTMALESTHLQSEQGRTITVKGTLTDNDGIASVNLSCPKLYLDKTIDLIKIYGEPQKSYELDYTHKIHSDLPTEEYTMTVTVTDVGGRSVSEKVKVTMDGDFVPPVFTARPSADVTVLIKAVTTLPVKFAVEDDKALASVTVSIPHFNISETITEFPDGRTYSYSNNFSVPSETGSYEVEVTAVDKFGQEAAFKATYSVQDLPDWDKMWLADVETSAELNTDICGVPMLIKHTGEYTYRARYYNKTAGTAICFIPQNTDFTPICFGPDKDNPSLLGDDPDATDRIVLEKAKTYYQIDFNTSTREFTVTDYAPADAPSPVKGMVYGQDMLDTWGSLAKGEDPWWQEWLIGPFSGFGDDRPVDKSVVTRMEQDHDNPNLFVIEQWVLDAGTLHFTIHNWHHDGWWNWTAWRVDNGTNPEKWEYYGTVLPACDKFPGNADYFTDKYGDNPDFDISRWSDENYRKQFVPDTWADLEIIVPGTYRFEFDAHLERAKMIRLN